MRLYFFDRSLSDYYYNPESDTVFYQKARSGHSKELPWETNTTTGREAVTMVDINGVKKRLHRDNVDPFLVKKDFPALKPYTD
jgi:hypothetical protein